MSEKANSKHIRHKRIKNRYKPAEMPATIERTGEALAALIVRNIPYYPLTAI